MEGPNGTSTRQPLRGSKRANGAVRQAQTAAAAAGAADAAKPVPKKAKASSGNAASDPKPVEPTPAAGSSPGSAAAASNGTAGPSNHAPATQGKNKSDSAEETASPPAAAAAAAIDAASGQMSPKEPSAAAAAAPSPDSQPSAQQGSPPGPADGTDRGPVIAADAAAGTSAGVPAAADSRRNTRGRRRFVDPVVKEAAEAHSLAPVEDDATATVAAGDLAAPPASGAVQPSSRLTGRATRGRSQEVPADAAAAGKPGQARPRRETKRKFADIIAEEMRSISEPERSQSPSDDGRYSGYGGASFHQVRPFGGVAMFMSPTDDG